MENNKFKKVSFKNGTCYYFDDIIKLKAFYLDNILIDKNHTQILWFKTFGFKPFRIRFDKIDGLIRIYDRSRYLTAFGIGNYDAIYNRIRYLR